ncbi:MAG: heparan-alpha-glucosaminide N-acetyltransferase domain-containing protein [Acidobacteriota bacterium]|nr:heparan-alpha-glucosaminide N-acetyltransferase domain-containing protein [Acidobacteriota bacterium]
MTNPATSTTRVQRLLSLDVLRGITIAFMIMVNNNGGAGSWGFMNHAAWNGLTPTDLVFPTFVFVVGASIAFAFDARLARGATRAELAWHTLRRAGILFALGVVVNGFPLFELTHLRIYGVLQRIAVCYLVVALFYLWDQRVWTKVAALVVALVGYWVLLRWVPVPGAGMPGRDFPFMDQSQNLVSWLDRQLMAGHLYLPWTTHDLRDPEGLLSDLPAVGTALLGLLAGLWMRGRKAAQTKTLGLAAGSVACLAAGYLWSVWFPLNKNLWTSSYVLVAAGWSLAVLTLAYWAVEQNGWGRERGKGWMWPWLVFGSNAIVAYMFSELLPSGLGELRFMADGRRTDVLGWLFRHTFAHIPDPGWAAFTYSVSFLAVCFVPVWVLYRKKIFVKV